MACMSSGVEFTEIDGGVGGVAMTFPVNDGGASPKLPRRLRRRLSECRSPVTVEEIEAKLKEADIRRQQFYDLLSSKARPKQRSPSRLSSQEVDLGQRIEAKLNAAEQKRLSILSKAQMRLARLEEVRQAAKNGVQMEVEKKRGELGMKVESRVKQAEANRMLIMKSRRQWRAMRKERTAQSLTRRMIQESKYKEHVQAAIHQKRLSAERKRLGLLEAERSKAHAWSSRVQRVANSIHNQREMERMKKRDQLEDRLQRARRQRAELLKQRKSLNNTPNADSYMMKEQAEKLDRILARFWRRFVETKGTTFFLVKAFEHLNINEKSVRSMPFEQLAYLIGSRSTLEIASSFLDRLEVHLRVRSGNNGSLGMENINHLLKRVATPVRKRYVNQTVKVGKQKKPTPAREKTQSSCELSRYPVRIALCAFMILGHPDAVFSGRGEDEIALAEAATKFIQEFELLTKVILEGGCIKSSSKSNNLTFRSQLEAFDKAWCLYLYRFVVWKVKDAKLLEEDLVRAACQMEVSMMHTCKLSPEGSSSKSNKLTHDMKAIQKQVLEDQTLLKEKVQNLSGVAGIVRMENAISDARARFFSKDTGSPFTSPVAHITSPSSGLSDTSPGIVTCETNIMADGGGQSSSVARSLFKEDIASENPVISACPPAPRGVGAQLSDLTLTPFTENEVLVNEIVHAQRHGFADSLGVDDIESGVKAKLKEAMEKAFWDGVMESMRQEQPDLSWVLKLLTEVRDELCEMSPESWRQEISDAIDIDILTQVLRNGTLDINYLGKIMEYALITLQKLSAPANDDEMKNAHQNLLVDLRQMSLTEEDSDSSAAVAVVKGLRFVLKQIQTLKKEISRARIRMIEPLIKGPAGLEYLQKAFSDRYGPPSNASASLPLTKNWLSLVRNNATQVWGEHLDSISTVPASPASGAQGIPSIALRTGGSVSAAPKTRSLDPITKDKEQPECMGERMDLFIRVGLLELVSQIEGLVQAALPETLQLNLSRLRTVQSQLQKIIVVSTSMLVLRQTLVTERLLTSPSDMDNIISQSARQLSHLLEKSEDVGLEEIVEVMIGLPESYKDAVNLEKLRSTMGVVTNLLSKSLQSGDPVFSSVSRAVRMATRAVVLGGTGGKGRHLAEVSLRRVGAAFLTDKVMDVAKVLIVMTTVSASVHGSWYEELSKNM
ncbi:uncharacterized protein LOC141596963 [Silene latifolia]|uniref:uncharacterized protein LOC141596963 n=1 Tax=Silene latifolia TaxID=37657 RepID=UPI003D771752